jgi:hypothetical protein
MAYLVERVGAFFGHEFLVDLPCKKTISSVLRVPSVKLVLLTLAASSALKYLLIEAIVISLEGRCCNLVPPRAITGER